MSQLVDDAIKDSRSRGVAVHIDPLDIRQAGLSVASVCDELEEVSEDFARYGHIKEYHGTAFDDEDNTETWCVRVRVSDGTNPTRDES